jgi:fructose-specific component phosphotransferase system IIB-like protein
MTAQAIEQTVLHLPKPDRAHLASLLLESLDEQPDVNGNGLWLTESKRRAAEIDQGQVSLVSGDTLHREVQSLFR